MPGLSRYQFLGSDLSSNPRDAMDPRNPALAVNRDPNYSRNPRPNAPIQEEPFTVPETGMMQDARRQGAQQQPGATNLLELLRRLGII
jgi:hypothetical protein